MARKPTVKAESPPIKTEDDPVEPVLSPLTPSLLNDKKTMVADAKLIASAIKKGWNIPDDLRAKLPSSIGELAINETVDPKVRVIAAKIILEMSKQNAGPSAPQSSVINVGVNIDNNPDAGGSRVRAIAQRLGTRRVSGESAGDGVTVDIEPVGGNPTDPIDTGTAAG